MTPFRKDEALYAMLKAMTSGVYTNVLPWSLDYAAAFLSQDAEQNDLWNPNLGGAQVVSRI